MNDLARRIFFALALIAPALAAQDVLRLALAPVAEEGRPGSANEGLTSDLAAQLGRFKFLLLVDRSKTKELLKEVALSESGFVNPATAVKSGEMQGVQALLVATASKTALTARILHIQSSRLIATASVAPGDAEKLSAKLASGVETFLARENLKSMRNDNPDIRLEFSVQRRAKGGGRLDTITSAKEGKARLGDTLVFSFKSSRDGFITLVDLQPSGDVVVLYPNDLTPDHKVAAGVAYAIPGAKDTFEITVSEPIGRDTVVAFFTEAKVPWLDRVKLEGEGFRTVKESERLLATRGLKITATGLKAAAWKSQVIEIDVEP
ncbi:MAG: DUF4384 domain-containing protein [Spirochaetes bacterium]|nr:DUF4384 domain-containing protein [Spirochaetota bacterium]